MSDTFFAPNLNQQPTPPAQEGGGAAAAFRLENDMYNLWAMSRRGQTPLDPTFDINKAAERSPLWLDHSERLAQAQSQAEFDSLSARIQQEQADRQRLQGMGLSGALLGMAAGLASPTMFIPLTGQARGAKGVAEAFALAAGAATAQELPLILNQQTRTALESGINIASGTVLGGLLGSAAVYLRRSDQITLARGIEADAEAPPLGYVVREPDGNYVSTARPLNLQQPAGVPQSPAAYNSVQQIGNTFDRIDRVAAKEDWPGVRRLAEDENTSPAVREAAREMLERTNIEPSLSSGMIRVYHSGVSGDGKTGRWVSTNKTYASNYRSDLPLYYTDLPDKDPRISSFYPEQNVNKGFTFNFELTPEEATNLKRIARKEEIVSPQEISRALREEKSAPFFTPAPRDKTAGVGAQRVGVRETPFVPVLNEATGQMEHVPTLDPSITPEVGGLANDPYGILTQISRINPVVRVIQQPGMPVKSKTAARSMMQLSDGGAQYQGGEFGLAPAPGGTVEDRLGFYFARMGAAMKFQYEAYMRYLGRADTFGNRRLTDFQSTFNIAPGAGKLSFAEFKEQVMDAFHNGMQSPVKEANEVAADWTKNYFGKVNEAMLDATEGRGAKALYEVLDHADPMRNYITHIYSVDKIVEDREGFIRLVADHLQSSTAAIAMRKWQKLMQREQGNLDLEEILRMDAEQARYEFDRIDDALKEMPRDADFTPEMQRVRDLRDQRRQLVDDEFDRLMDESPVYRRGDEDSERAAKDMARQNIKEDYQALTDEIAAAEAQVPKGALQTADQRKALKRRKAALLKSFGALQEKQADAMRRINQNEAKNLAALERFQDQAVRLTRQLEGIDDAKLDAELTKLDTQLNKAIAQIEKSEKQLEKLQKNVGTEFEPTERISIAEARKALREERAENTFARYGKRLAYDREGARQAIRDRLAASREYVNRVNSARAERNAKLRDSIKKNDPAQAEANVQGLRQANTDRRASFMRWLEESEVSDADLDNGVFDFSEAAEKYASALSYKITGTPMRIGQLETLPGLKGPMKRRVLDIPYEQKKAFLETDSERVLSVYTRSMGADIELYRAFGSVNGGNMLANVQEELAQTERFLRTRTVDDKGKPIAEATRKKQLKAHEAGARDIMNSLQHAITRLRGLAGMPEDPASFWYRAGRSLMHFNVMTMMGSAAITSIPDIARTVMVHGMNRTLRDSWGPMIGGLVNESTREVTKAQIRQLNLMNIGIEMFTQQRAQSAFDITADTAGRTKAERLIELGGVKTAQIALFGPMTDMTRILAGMATMSRMLDNVDTFAAGRMKPNSPELEYMARAGLEPQMIERIARQLNEPDGHTMMRGVKVPNLESWTDYAALRAFSAAMQRESNNIVIQPGLERMNIADKNMLTRLIFQFRSFTMAAHAKMLVSGLQQRDMAAFRAIQGVSMSLALGALSYYTWARATSDRATEEMQNAGWETWMDQAIYRSGLTGAFSEIQSIGSQIPGVADFVTFEGGALAGRRPASLIGAVAGPSFGTAETIAGVLQGMSDPTETTVRQARKLIPYQNVFYLRRALNIMEEQTADALGLPESRR